MKTVYVITATSIDTAATTVFGVFHKQEEARLHLKDAVKLIAEGSPVVFTDADYASVFGRGTHIRYTVKIETSKLS